MNIDYHFQAHRGSMSEAHENTLSAMQYAWSFPNAIPETDIRQLSDGSLVCCHDDTLARTGKGEASLLAKPLSQMALAELRKIDVGDGECVPLLTELLDLMQGHKDRSLYLEIKDAPLDRVVAMLKDYDVLDRTRFVHKEQSFCKRIQERIPQAFTMTWCSGNRITEHFHLLAESGFIGISEVQIHFPATMGADEKLQTLLPKGFLHYALTKTEEHGRILQVCPLSPSPQLLRYLYTEGVRSFVSDAPQAFTIMMDKALCS